MLNTALISLVNMFILGYMPKELQFNYFQIAFLSQVLLVMHNFESTGEVEPLKKLKSDIMK